VDGTFGRALKVPASPPNVKWKRGPTGALQIRTCTPDPPKSRCPPPVPDSPWSALPTCVPMGPVIWVPAIPVPPGPPFRVKFTPRFQPPQNRARFGSIERTGPSKKLGWPGPDIDGQAVNQFGAQFPFLARQAPFFSADWLFPRFPFFMMVTGTGPTIVFGARKPGGPRAPGIGISPRGDTAQGPQWALAALREESYRPGPPQMFDRGLWVPVFGPSPEISPSPALPGDDGFNNPIFFFPSVHPQ